MTGVRAESETPSSINAWTLSIFSPHNKMMATIFRYVTLGSFFVLFVSSETIPQTCEAVMRTRFSRESLVEGRKSKNFFESVSGLIDSWILVALGQ